MIIGLSHYLAVAAILFTLGIFGIFVNRKNVIVILMSIELMLLVELFLVVGSWVLAPQFAEMIAAPTPPIADISNTEAIGRILYTKYVYFFQAAGLILLVAMVGAIVLTLRHKPNVKRQNIGAQVGRTREQSIEIVKVRSGQGLPEEAP